MTNADDSDAEVPNRTNQNILECTIISVLNLLARAVRTFVWMLQSPKKFADTGLELRSALVPPYTLLVMSLLLAGLGIRLGIAFFEQAVDHAVFRRLAETIGTVSLEDVFVLTVPSIIFVAVVGAGIARCTTRTPASARRVVIHCVCYCASLQFICIGFCCLIVLAIKLSSGRSEVVPGHLFDRIVATSILLLVVISSRPLYYSMRMVGDSPLVSNRFAASLLSLTAAGLVLVGVGIVNAVSFDLGKTIAEARQRHQHQVLADVYVAAKTLTSQMTRLPSGEVAIELNLALVNVSEETVLVPKPFELEYAHDPKRSPLRLLDTAASREEAGWVLLAGESRIVHWMLSVPDWCSDPSVQKSALPVLFSCHPFAGTRDMLNVHPIGESCLVLAELQWPLSEAWRMSNHQEIARISQMISAGELR